jgi:hypothetical protein
MPRSTTELIRRREFVASALASEQDVAKHAFVYDGDEVPSYLRARLQGDKPERPRKKRL